MLAGKAVNVWDMSQEIKMEKVTFSPAIGEQERESRHKRWKMAVDRSLGWSKAEA